MPIATAVAISTACRMIRRRGRRSCPLPYADSTATHAAWKTPTFDGVTGSAA